MLGQNARDDGVKVETLSNREYDIPKRPLPVIPTQSIELNELAHKPEKFDGRRDKALHWIEDCETAAVANQWSDNLKTKPTETSFDPFYFGHLRNTLREICHCLGTNGILAVNIARLLEKMAQSKQHRRSAVHFLLIVQNTIGNRMNCGENLTIVNSCFP